VELVQNFLDINWTRKLPNKAWNRIREIRKACRGRRRFRRNCCPNNWRVSPPVVVLCSDQVACLQETGCASGLWGISLETSFTCRQQSGWRWPWRREFTWRKSTRERIWLGI